MECTRGYRSFLNMLRDPVDDYIEHKDEIEEILKPFTTVPQVQVSPINQEIYISSNHQDQDKDYTRVIELYINETIFTPQMKMFWID